MQSDTMTVQKVFQDRRQYRVPFFQRPYVWNKEDQWERLWSDITEKADARLQGERPSPHFLGATVFEPQPRQGLLGVETLHIIDGQQRLTTLQYALAALAIVLRQREETTLLSLVDGCLRNSNAATMNDPDVEVFKVWPTFRDRTNYELAMEADSLDVLRERFPASFTQGATLRKVGIDHPPPLEAVWYFAERIQAWIARPGDNPAPVRLQAITTSLLSDLRMVCISLDEHDDAQIIFETLNGHGAQLHATDLIRNYIFMRADREPAKSSELFDTLWSPFEGSFWSEPQRRGRLLKPRMEWFVQTALQSVFGEQVEVGRLYAEYRRFSEGRTAAAQLQTLDAYAANYRQLVTGAGEDPIARFGRRTRNWDASTTHPLALQVAAAKLPDGDQAKMYDDVTSYLVRRAVCGLTTKNYNKVFLQIVKRVLAGDVTPEGLRNALAALEGDASRWPRDDEFRNSWLTARVYPGRLDAPRMKSVFAELEAGLRSPRSEEPLPLGVEVLDVDHILPDSWYEHWPLSDGSKVTASQAAASTLSVLTGQDLTERQHSIHRRESTKATIGNLTLLHYGVNRSLQNREFSVKREKLFAESNLQLNRALMRLELWDEAAIAKRGETLFETAKRLWPSP